LHLTYHPRNLSPAAPAQGLATEATESSLAMKHVTIRVSTYLIPLCPILCQTWCHYEYYFFSTLKTIRTVVYNLLVILDFLFIGNVSENLVCHVAKHPSCPSSTKKKNNS